MSIPGSASPLFIGAAAGAAAAYQIDRSLRFNSADSAYLNRTPSSAGNRKTWTWAGWVKRNAISSGTGQNIFVGSDNPTKNNTTHSAFYFHPSDKLYFGGWNSVYIITDAVYRDPSAWYHIVLTVDTNQSTATDRIKVYVNNVLQTYSQGAGFPGQSTDLGINQTYAHYIGGNDPQSGYASHMYADIHFIDGQALAPTDFGEYDDNNAWQPKAYAGTYGTNGFHLDFSDNSSNAALGTDSSGNSNDWTVNNISVAAGAGNDSLVDTPTNYGTDDYLGGSVRGNYAVMNALVQGSGTTLDNGNLDIAATGSAWNSVFGTIFVSSGKYYAEVTAIDVDSDYSTKRVGVGFARSTTNLMSTASTYLGGDTFSGAYFSNGNVFTNNTNNNVNSSFQTGDVIGVALDMDAGTVTFYKNNTVQPGTFTGLSGENCIAVSVHGSGGKASINFGQRPFAYSAPSGFKALCTQNLDDPTIADGSTAMDAVLYTGTNASKTITGLNFSPDFIWTKSRSRIDSHGLHDIVRGRASNLYSDATYVENTSSASADLVSFDSNGYTLGTVEQTAMNRSGETYVAWAWDGGTSTVSNTDGSITSNVRANTSAGFSIVTYAGTGTAATIGHGLGAAPGLIILKDRDSAYNWQVYHSIFAGTSNSIVLNSTGTVDTGSGGVWNSTAPTSTVFSIGTSVGVNTSGNDYVAYCFAPVEGYSAFGSYVGTGTSDNSAPFVYTGLRPAFVLIKNASAAANWMLYDTARNPSNEAPYVLGPNNSDGGLTYDAYSGSYPIDILSNGFKPRSTLSNINGSGNTLVYACFSEHPFKTARAR